MKSRHFIAIAVGAAALAGLGTYAYHWPVGSPPTQHNASQSAHSGDMADNSRAALLMRPEVRRFRERIAFQDMARRYFAQAASLPATARDQQAQSLRRQIDRYEGEGGLSAGEAIALRIGLIRATEADPERQAELLADLVARYRLDAERRNLAFHEAQRRDPAFNGYKAREAGVVAEVMAMTQIPRGLSRDEYLRQRLQHEREIAYGNR